MPTDMASETLLQLWLKLGDSIVFFPESLEFGGVQSIQTLAMHCTPFESPETWTNDSMPTSTSPASKAATFDTMRPMRYGASGDRST